MGTTQPSHSLLLIFHPKKTKNTTWPRDLGDFRVQPSLYMPSDTAIDWSSILQLRLQQIATSNSGITRKVDLRGNVSWQEMKELTDGQRNIWYAHWVLCNWGEKVTPTVPKHLHVLSCLFRSFFQNICQGFFFGTVLLVFRKKSCFWCPNPWGVFCCLVSKEASGVSVEFTPCSPLGFQPKIWWL